MSAATFWAVLLSAATAWAWVAWTFDVVAGKPVALLALSACLMWLAAERTWRRQPDQPPASQEPAVSRRPAGP